MITLLLAAAVAAPNSTPQPSKEFVQACYARARSEAERDFCTAGEDAVRRQMPPDTETDRCLNENTTQGGMNACAGAAFKRADARMNAQWAKTAAAFKRMDQNSKGTPWPTKAFDSLLQGQRAWLTYREETCRAEGLVNAGGSIAPMNELLCLESITDLRIKELVDLSRNPNNPDEPIS